MPPTPAPAEKSQMYYKPEEEKDEGISCELWQNYIHREQSQHKITKSKYRQLKWTTVIDWFLTWFYHKKCIYYCHTAA